MKRLVSTDKKQIFDITVVYDKLGVQILAQFKHGTVLIGSAKTHHEAEEQARLWIEENSDWAMKQFNEG